MHNITSVFLLCKLFLLLFLSFPSLVLGYLGHLQPVGHLPVGTKWTASTQLLCARSHKCSCIVCGIASALRQACSGKPKTHQTLQSPQKCSYCLTLLHRGASKAATREARVNKNKIEVSGESSKKTTRPVVPTQTWFQAEQAKVW